MKKLLALCFIGGLAIAQATVCQAAGIQVAYETTSASTNDLVAGVFSDTNKFTTFFSPPAPLQSLLEPGNLTFGQVATIPLVALPTSDTYTNVKANFNFDITIDPTNALGHGPVTKHFELDGLLNGSFNVNASGISGGNVAHSLTASSLKDLDTASGLTLTAVTAAVNPTGQAGFERLNIAFGSFYNVDIFFNSPNTLSRPFTNTSILGIGGFIRVNENVPEPGTLALLCSTGVMGSVALLRRRRKA